mmetsp:Transcript_14988/g.29435  ORF Transcript_14988/g.29435 Transcript_14988/m.29435 type:complete len:107 (-) Transcript_14988:40-360(-)
MTIAIPGLIKSAKSEHPREISPGTPSSYNDAPEKLMHMQSLMIENVSTANTKIAGLRAVDSSIHKPNAHRSPFVPKKEKPRAGDSMQPVNSAICKNTAEMSTIIAQ